MVGVALVVGALFAWQACTLTADETTAQQSLVIVDSGSTDGLDDVYTWSATVVDYNGVAHVGIDQIRQFFARDLANGLDITTIGHPTTIGSIVSTPFEWDSENGDSGRGMLTSQLMDGKVVYSTIVVGE